MVNLDGVTTALVTPFRSDGEIDFSSLDRLVEFQLEHQVPTLLLLGSTGEAKNMEFNERSLVLKAAQNRFEKTGIRPQVMVGISAANTIHNYNQAKQAVDEGADVLLVCNPDYVKGPQDGIFDFIGKMTEFGKPVVIYNIAGRAGASASPQTVIQAAYEFDLVIGNKWADGYEGGDNDLFHSLAVGVPEGFYLLSGDDPYTLRMMQDTNNVTRGVVSVASNIIPGPMIEMVNAQLTGNSKRANELQAQYGQAIEAIMTVRSNPMGIKGALKLMADDIGLKDYVDHLRGPPLRPCYEDELATLDAALEPVRELYR